MSDSFEEEFVAVYFSDYLDVSQSSFFKDLSL